MTASRTTDDADTLGINTQPVCVLAQPTYRRFAIVEVLWPDRFRAFRELVIDAHGNIAIARERATDVDLTVSIAPSAILPAAMNHDHRRQSGLLWHFQWEIEVRLFSPVSGKKCHVPFHSDIRRNLTLRLGFLGNQVSVDEECECCECCEYRKSFHLFQFWSAPLTTMQPLCACEPTAPEV